MAKDILNGVVLTGLVFLAAAFLPIVGIFGAVLAPLPTLYYRVKLGRKGGCLIPILSVFMFTALLGGISIDSVFLFGLLFAGFVLGELFELQLSIEKTFIYASASVLIAEAAALLIISASSATGIHTTISEYIDRNLGLVIAVYRDLGMPAETLEQVSRTLADVHYYLVRILPSLVVSSTLILIWSSILLARPLLRRKNQFCPDFGRLNQWKAPDFLVWGVITCGLIILIFDNPIMIVGLNVLIILLPIYFFQGIAIVSFFFEKKGVPHKLRVVLYAIIAIQQLLLLAVIGLGFFDMWLNFRKIETN
jgi:uncharacterized protein YybS (DUF2232 family)